VGKPQDLSKRFAEETAILALEIIQTRCLTLPGCSSLVTKTNSIYRLQF